MMPTTITIGSQCCVGCYAEIRSGFQGKHIDEINKWVEKSHSQLYNTLLQVLPMDPAEFVLGYYLAISVDDYPWGKIHPTLSTN